MIRVGPFVVDENELDGEKLFKELSNLSSEELASYLIENVKTMHDLERTNTIFHNEMMKNKTGVGGVTVDKF